MRDEDGRIFGWGWAAVVAVSAALPAAVAAQSLRGVAEAHYQNSQGAALPSPLETWGKSLSLDYSRSLPGEVSLSSRFRFAEQTIVGRGDRLRVPEGSLRLGHRYAGFSVDYKPSEARDATLFTTRRQDLTLSGYAQKPGLPSLSGSWVRNHINSGERTAGAATVTRSLGAIYSLPGVALRAGYGDRLLEPDASAKARTAENHYSLGTSSQFQVGRAPVSLQYDFGQGRTNPLRAQSQTSRSHTASASTAYQFSPKLSSGLGYNYRRTALVRPAVPATEEHNGAASLAYSLLPTVRISGGGGVRSATFAGRTRTERFLVGTLAGEGQARPGWRIGASASRSMNWLPGEKARPSDALQSSATMQLTKGLSARADLGVSSVGGLSKADSLESLDRTTLQTGGGITATPLRTVYMDVHMQRGRVSSSLFEGGPTSSSYAFDLRLVPSSRFQASGAWGLVRGSESEGRTFRASLQWAPFRSLQASGSYNRGSQELLKPVASRGARQESFSASAAMALGREMNASVQYTEANHGQPSEGRQIGVNIARRFGR